MTKTELKALCDRQSSKTTRYYEYVYVPHPSENYATIDRIARIKLSTASALTDWKTVYDSREDANE